MSIRFRRFVPWIAAVCAGAAYLVAARAILGNAALLGSNRKLAVLGLEYAFLLPVLLALLRFWGRKQGPSNTGRRGILAGLALLLYLAATIPVAFVTRNGIYNADESAYQFESKAILTGRFTAMAPPRVSVDPATYQREFFFEHHVIHDNKWFGKYPPGWPVLLAAGFLLHAGWLVNPVLGLVIALCAYLIARRGFDERTARTAVFILALSPYFVLNCVGYMSHPACGAAIAGAAVLLWDGLASRRLSRFAAAFVLLGIGFLARPSTASVIGAVMVAVVLWSLRNDSTFLLRVFGVAVLAGFGAIALYLLHNQSLTGSPFVSPYQLFREVEYSPDTSFTLQNILHNLRTITPVNLVKTSVDAMPFVFLLAIVALVAERKSRIALLAFLFAILVVLHLGMVEVSDSIIGERYYFEAYFAVAILAARGWLWLTDRWQLPRDATIAVTALVFAVQATVYFADVRAILWLKGGYGRVLGTVDQMHLSRAVVLMRSAPGFRPKNFNPNSADWEHEPVFYVRDPGPALREQLVCSLGRGRWVLVSYAHDRNAAVILGQGKTACEDYASGVPLSVAAAGDSRRGR